MIALEMHSSMHTNEEQFSDAPSSLIRDPPELRQGATILFQATCSLKVPQGACHMGLSLAETLIGQHPTCKARFHWAKAASRYRYARGLCALADLVPHGFCLAVDLKVTRLYKAGHSGI